jgi:hypothetical protein
VPLSFHCSYDSVPFGCVVPGSGHVGMGGSFIRDSVRHTALASAVPTGHCDDIPEIRMLHLAFESASELGRLF